MEKEDRYIFRKAREQEVDVLKDGLPTGKKKIKRESKYVRIINNPRSV